MVLQKSIVKHLGYVKTIELHEYLLSGSIMIAHNEVITLIIVSSSLLPDLKTILEKSS